MVTLFVLFNFIKAFDSVCYDLFLHKISNFRLSYSVLN